MLRERAGIDRLAIDLPSAATVADAAEQLAIAHPQLRGLLSSVAFAVNQEYAPVTSTLHDGDELALIPPVSGG